MDIQQEQAEELVEAFGLFDEWEDRYAFLSDLGRQLPPMNEAEKTEENRIQGCQNRVWVAPKLNAEHRVEFEADSESSIVKGLVAILHRVYSGQPPDKILSFDIQNLLARLDLEQHLSMNRRNGLLSIIERLKKFAASAT